MKKPVKILSVVLALVFLLPTTVLAVNEKVSNKVMSGDGDTSTPLSYEEQVAQINNDITLTTEQKKVQISKLSFAEEVNNIEKSVSLSKSTKDSMIENLNTSLLADSGDIMLFAYNPPPGNIFVTYYKQITNKHCGPATVQQTLKTLGVNPPSQATIAADPAFGGFSSSGGTHNPTMMRQYINSKGGVNYVQVANVQQSTMQNCLNTGLFTYKIPPILRMAANSTDVSQGKWRYTTDGHYLNISGRSATNTYQVCDPYIQYVDSTVTTGKYFKSMSDIYTVTTRHHAKSFWY